MKRKAPPRKVDAGGLNPKQRRFVDEYLIDHNATQAAIRAGYSAATADVQGPTLLGNPRVAGAIELGTKAQAERLGLTADRAKMELARIAYADIRKAMKWDKDCVSFIPSDELPDDIAMAIAEVGSETTTRAVGDDLVTTVKLKLKFHPKLPALEQLAKHHGWFAPIRNQTENFDLDGLALLTEGELNEFLRTKDLDTAAARIAAHRRDGSTTH